MEERATRANIAYLSRLLSARPAKPRSPPSSRLEANMPAQGPVPSDGPPLPAKACDPPASEIDSTRTTEAEAAKEHELCWHCSKAAAQLKVPSFYSPLASSVGHLRSDAKTQAWLSPAHITGSSALLNNISICAVSAGHSGPPGRAARAQQRLAGTIPKCAAP